MPPHVHSDLGASGASRWLFCPGSVNMSRGMPNITTPSAQEGTDAHQLGEMGLNGYNLGSLIGQELPRAEGNGSFEVTKEMVDYVNLYVRTVFEWLARVNLRPEDLHIEKDFSLELAGRPDMFGTNDASFGVVGERLFVFDLKYGKGNIVEVEDNDQLLYYAAGAILEACKQRKCNPTEAFKDVVIVIVQPRMFHENGPVRWQMKTTVEVMDWLHTRLLPGAKATDAPDAPLRAGDKCLFCDGKAKCPEQRNHANALARNTFSPVPRPLPPPESLTDVQIGEILAKAEMVEDWIKSCREYVRVGLETGKVRSEDVGYKLVEGRASRKWANEADIEKHLIMLLGDKAYKKSLLSPAQAEKELGGSAKDNLKQHIISTRGTQIVPNSDKRAAVQQPPQTAFPAVTV